MEQGLEREIVRLDQALAEAEKMAAGVLGRVRGMRKWAGDGDLGSVAGAFEPLREQLAGLAASFEGARGGMGYDLASAMEAGDYTAELKEEAKVQGLQLHEAEGRLTAFPLLLKLEPKLGGVRVGRKLERGVRPSRLVKMLLKAQAAARFKPERFLGQVFRAYEVLAPGVQQGWRADRAGAGPVVALNKVHELLTLMPSAAAEYPREAFACDLLSLNGAPDTHTGAGHRFSLPASTGSKGRERLTVFDAQGRERVFVGVQFTLPQPGGGG